MSKPTKTTKSQASKFANTRSHYSATARGPASLRRIRAVGSTEATEAHTNDPFMLEDLFDFPTFVVLARLEDDPEARKEAEQAHGSVDGLVRSLRLADDTFLARYRAWRRWSASNDPFAYIEERRRSAAQRLTSTVALDRITASLALSVLDPVLNELASLDEEK
jgi:hypothetical protein